MSYLWKIVPVVALLMSVFIASCGTEAQRTRVNLDESRDRDTSPSVYGRWGSSRPTPLPDGEMDVMYIIEAGRVSVEATCRFNNGAVIYASTMVAAEVKSDRIVFAETRTAVNADPRGMCRYTLPRATWYYSRFGDTLTLNHDTFRKL